MHTNHDSSSRRASAQRLAAGQFDQVRKRHRELMGAIAVGLISMLPLLVAPIAAATSPGRAHHGCGT